MRIEGRVIVIVLTRPFAQPILDVIFQGNFRGEFRSYDCDFCGASEAECMGSRALYACSLTTFQKRGKIASKIDIVIITRRYYSACVVKSALWGGFLKVPSNFLRDLIARKLKANFDFDFDFDSGRNCYVLFLQDAVITELFDFVFYFFLF